ncbi:MAG: class I tRNA ligase family protein [Gorillibacterium sp.]|nr:class I tRNA ligase family protein [Gorillibacterium sp.]
MDPAIRQELTALYEETGQYIVGARLKQALDHLFTYVRKANKYFDERKPWKNVQDAPDQADNTLYTCVQIIANLSNLLSPFLPFSSEQIHGFLGQSLRCWHYIEVVAGTTLQAPKILFERIDPKQIDAELLSLAQSVI